MWFYPTYYKQHRVWTAWHSGLVLIACCPSQLVSVVKPESHAVGRQTETALPMQHSCDCDVQCAVVHDKGDEMTWCVMDQRAALHMVQARESLHHAPVRGTSAATE